MIKNISTRIRELRIENRLTQVELANLLGFSKQFLNNLEKGRTSLSLQRLISTADFFDVSIDYLVGQSNRQTPFTSKNDVSEHSHNAKNFALRLNYLRGNYRFTQKQLAEFIGVTAQHVGKMERGEVTPSVEKLIVISNLFDVSIDYLVGRTDDINVI